MDKTLNKYKSLRSQEFVFLTHEQFIDLCQNHGFRLQLVDENAESVQIIEPVITGGKTSKKDASDSTADTIETKE